MDDDKPRLPKALWPKVQMGRIAFRQEGENWNAYYALPDTMQGAIYLGSIKMAIVDRDPARKAAFMGLMREGVGDIIEESSGVRPSWPEPGGHVAPDHERSKE